MTDVEAVRIKAVLEERARCLDIVQRSQYRIAPHPVDEVTRVGYFDTRMLSDIASGEDPRQTNPVDNAVCRSLTFDNGMTVSDLKRAVLQWPELYGDGEQTTVWVLDSLGLGNEVFGIAALNVREAEGGGEKSSDIALMMRGVRFSPE